MSTATNALTTQIIMTAGTQNFFMVFEKESEFSDGAKRNLSVFYLDNLPIHT